MIKKQKKHEKLNYPKQFDPSIPFCSLLYAWEEMEKVKLTWCPLDESLQLMHICGCPVSVLLWDSERTLRGAEVEEPERWRNVCCCDGWKATNSTLRLTLLVTQSYSEKPDTVLVCCWELRNIILNGKICWLTLINIQLVATAAHWINVM